MSRTTSRRAILGALAATPVAAIPALAALPAGADEAHPDAALLLLGVRFDAAEAAYSAACDRAEAIRAVIVFPERPAAVYAAEGDRALRLRGYATEHDDRGVWYPVPHANAPPGPGLRQPRLQLEERDATPADGLPANSMIARYVPWPEAQARADEIVSATEAWRAERDRIDVESGLEAANQAADALGEELSDIEAAIEDATARTLDGLRVKARIARRDFATSDQINEALHEGLIRDILAMGGEA